MKNIYNTYDVINKSGINFGTSGARGLVTDFTPEVCAAFTISFLTVMQQRFSFTTVALAIDNRPSSYAMAQACAAALQEKGIKTVYYGVIPTPALAHQSISDKVPAIMVTGSHIPFDRNGLKFYRPDGEITKDDENAIIHVDASFMQPKLEQLTISTIAARNYILRYTSLFPMPFLKNKRIGIYEHSSAGRDLYKTLFKMLGATVVSLARSDEFVPIDTEAVSEDDRNKAITWAKKYQLDAIFSTDGDGDRPLIADEYGNWLRGDILGLLCSLELAADAVAIPVSCNSTISSGNFFKHVERTKIGSPYVIAAFAKLSANYNCIAGFEANGGFLLGSDVYINQRLLKALPTRDALLPAIMLLFGSKDKSISELFKKLPARYTYSNRLQDISVKTSMSLINLGLTDQEDFLQYIGFNKHHILHSDVTDGFRITIDNNNIIHLRPSGNAPELRCYAEADSQEDACNIVETVLSNIKSKLGRA
ncbi:phosphomannomutase [Salmonella enterica]|nr:phosphomannomutase [Salmonella enterica]EIL8018721.1 phosphomannomutase [Salmonella enterica]